MVQGYLYYVIPSSEGKRERVNIYLPVEGHVSSLCREAAGWQTHRQPDSGAPRPRPAARMDAGGRALRPASATSPGPLAATVRAPVLPTIW